MRAKVPGVFLAVAFTVVAASCSTPLSQLKTELGPRASSELNCPETRLEYKELERVISSTRVAVTGCGRSAKYKLVESQWSLDGSRDAAPLLKP